MREMRREPEVLEAIVQAVESLDGHARITFKDRAPNHSVNSGTLQNACSTRRRVVADLVRGARMHTVRLTNSLTKGSKKNGDKSAVAMLKKHESHDRTGRAVVYDSSKTTTFGLRIPGYGVAEVFIDFEEELRHTETDPMCKIHKSRCTSR